MNDARVRLSLGVQIFEFAETQLIRGASRLTDVFVSKNNKTVRETLQHPRYSKLANPVQSRHPQVLDTKLGDFLRALKQSGDPFYREFLNPNGDGQYSEFKLADPLVKRLKGLYCFTVDGQLKYIGKSTDSFAKRIDQGYGKIHPKNCFRDGQSTNCHLNALISQVEVGLCLHLHPMVDRQTIEFTEKALIVKYDPEWNVQLRATPRVG